VVALLVALVVGVALVVLLWAQVGAARGGPDGYPQRIGYEGSPAELPDRPGALAATVRNNNFGMSVDLAVSPEGRLWRLGGGPNVPSPDGSLLLRTEPTPRSRPLVVHDLGTGQRLRVDGVADSRLLRFQLAPDEPVYWAADSTRALITVVEPPRLSRHRPMVLDARSGTLTAVRGGVPAGFRSADQPVTVHRVAGGGATGGIVATTTDLLSRRSQDLQLRLASPWLGDPDARLSASVSPDGTTLVLVQVPKGDYPDAVLRLFSMKDGHELPSRSIENWDGHCRTAWLGDDPVLPTKSQGRPAGSVLVAADDTRQLVAVHPRLQSFCVQWAGDALAEGPGWSLFGTRGGRWTWYWWLVLPVVAVPLAGVVLAWRRQRRARRSLVP